MQTDKEALVALYDATSGRFWATGRNENWLTDAPLSEWHGVTTDPNGRVVELKLSEAGLIGEIPRELGDLDFLNPNPPNRVVVALERDLPGMERGPTRRISGGRGQYWTCCRLGEPLMRWP